MKKTVLVSCIMLCACSSPSKIHTLNLASGIEIVPSIVDNPYPDCEGSTKGQRIADLSKDRGLRVYLEDGKLCQRPY